MEKIAVKAKMKLLNLTEAEEKFIEYKLGIAGSFYTGLFDLFWHADYNNKKKLEIAFPKEIEVIRRYSEEEGYWEYLSKKAGIEF